MANIWSNNVLSSNGGGGGGSVVAMYILACMCIVGFCVFLSVGVFWATKKSSFVPSNEKQVYWGA